MYYLPIYMTDMITIGVFILLLAIGCILAGYVLVRFKFYPIIYFIKGQIVKDKVLSDIENVHLKSIKQNYGKILTAIPILGFSWGLFGITLTCFIVFNQFLSYLSSTEVNTLLMVVNYWVLSNIILLAMIPLLFLFTKASIPVGMKRSFNKTFFLFLLAVLISSLLYGFGEYDLSIPGLSVLFLLSIPCVFSSWFIGQYFAVYIIRSFYQSTGWDFVLNEKTSIFGRFKGFFSLIFAFFTPILAINSLVAVIYKNTNKGGFIGIYLLSLPALNFRKPFTFVEPSFEFLASVIILFLIVGPLVTFIFRPTYIFELTLNSKIYQTLINFNWEHFKEHFSESNDSIIIHSLTGQEMVGVLIFFISFINYIAILSVGAVVASFQINLDQFIGLGIINGTIKLIEIPIFFFVEFLIFHDLSEERELVHLASKGRKLAKKGILPAQFSKKIIVPKEQESSHLN